MAALDPGTDVAREMIAKGIPASVVRPVAEVLDAPETAASGMVTDVDGIRMLGIPVRLSRTPGSVRTPPRPLGADQRREDRAS